MSETRTSNDRGLQGTTASASNRLLLVALLLGALLGAAGCTGGEPHDTLLHVSYDPTRELLKEFNAAFTAEYNSTHKVPLTVRPSHGGSSSQASSVINGLDADIVSLPLWSDVNAIASAGLIDDGWEDRFPHKSMPFYSTIVFVVRPGNPHGIKDWPDLVRDDIKVITPDPKTSGNGKLSLLAAYGSIVLRGGSREDALKYLTELYRRVPVLATGARGATTTFAQKGIGDVHLTWENEALLEIRESGGTLEIVYPPISIRAEPKVALVDANVRRHESQEAAEEYVKYLYSDAGQEIIAEGFYRPVSDDVLARHKATFPELELFTIDKIAPDWAAAISEFFTAGGVFDQIYEQAVLGK